MIFVGCPNRHNIPMEPTEGEAPNPVIQAFKCPTCGEDFTCRTPYPVRIKPVNLF